MNASSTFFKLFPPPAFLTMPHAGMDVSDDGIRCIRYEGAIRSRRVDLAAGSDFPPGLVDGGDIKDAKEFTDRIKAFATEHHLNRVRISIPEEKAYLFQTEVFGADKQSIVQNIEFKLEVIAEKARRENPLSISSTAMSRPPKPKPIIMPRMPPCPSLTNSGRT